MSKFEKKYIPNYLTVLRFIFVPIIFALIFTEHYLSAFIVFLLSGISDVLDGRIARKYNYITENGTLGDPLADKITQISTVTALIIKKIIPFWILIIITVKELIMIIVAFNVYKKKTIVVKSDWHGKVTTVMFFIAIILSLLSKIYEPLSNITIYLFYAAIGMSVFTAISYGKNLITKELKRDKVTV